MKSITGNLFFIILLLGIFSISARPYHAWEKREKTGLDGKLEEKLEKGLIEWIRYLYPAEIEDYLQTQAEVKLVAGRHEYAFRLRDYPIYVNFKVPVAVPLIYYGFYKQTITIGAGRTYELDVCTDFVRLLETEDALFAYTGMLALNKRIFQGPIEDLLNASLVTKMADFMMRSGKNPYAYLQFIRHLYSFLNPGNEINPKVLLKSTELLDNLTGAGDLNYSFQPLSSKLMMKGYLEKKMQFLAEKLQVSNQYKNFKVELFKEDIVDSSQTDWVDLSRNNKLGLYISHEYNNRRSLLLRLPEKWSEIFTSEDQFVALILYALYWNQEALSKRDGLWGPDAIEKIDRNVVDTLLALQRPLDLDAPRGYNPKEYFNLLTRIARKPKMFEGMFEDIQNILKSNQISHNTRITAVQGYLTKLEIKHADAFADTYPFQVFAEKTKAQKSFKTRVELNIEDDGEEIQGLPSTITYQEFTAYLENNFGETKLDLLASQLFKLLPANELTFSVLSRFFQEEKLKEERINAQKAMEKELKDEKNKDEKVNPEPKIQETRLPICVLTALNTFLSRLEETNMNHWAHWDSVFELVFQDGIVSQDKFRIPTKVCDEWEANYLKLLSIQIEGTDFFCREERAKLVKKLHNFSKVLGPCENSLSKDRIFNLLMSSNKIDLALMFEWDIDNYYPDKAVIKQKGLNDLNFLESNIFYTKESSVNILALEAIRKLPPEVLRINSLEKLSLAITHESYLRALVRRAGKLYYDQKNLSNLHIFLNKHPNLASSMQYHDRLRMARAAIQQEEVPLHKILLPFSQNRHDMEKVVSALLKGRFSHVESLSVIIKMGNRYDLIKYYLDQKPLANFDELIEFLTKASQPEYRALFADWHDQYFVFQRISEQIPDKEYSIANLTRLQQTILETKAQLNLPGLHPIFFKALKLLKDQNELAQVHRIWLESMAVLDPNVSKWVIEPGKEKNYYKAVLAALKAEDEDLILEYPTFSSTDQAREKIFSILMKSDLSNEFIHKWIEAVFAEKTEKSERKEKEKFLAILHEQRPSHSLEDVASFLNQARYGTHLKTQQAVWKDCKNLFRTVPKAEFIPEKVKNFSSSIKDPSASKYILAISTLAINGWFLKYTSRENTQQLVQIFETIRNTPKEYEKINRTFYNQIASHFAKMIRALVTENPKLLFDTFTPASFSLERERFFQMDVNWEQELFRIAKKAGADSETLLRMLLNREQESLIVSVFSEFYSDFDQSQLMALGKILSYVNNADLRDKIAYKLIINCPEKLRFNIPEKEFTWQSVSLFASLFKDGSKASIYAMLRLLEFSTKPEPLAVVHSFLTQYTSKNIIDISSRHKTCDILRSNFDKMVKGSFAFGNDFQTHKLFTPNRLGCYPIDDDYFRKFKEQKKQFQVFINAAKAGVIDREEILIELQESVRTKHKYKKAIEQVLRIMPIDSFADLEALLISTEKRKNDFKLNGRIFDEVIDHFPNSQFKQANIQPVLRFLFPKDQKRIVLRLAKTSHSYDDMDFVARAGQGEVLAEEKLYRPMMRSIKKNPENILRFPIRTVAREGLYYILGLENDWYEDSFIQNNLIPYWISSKAPKEYLLAWLRYLPLEFGKRDQALEHFIQKAKIRSLAEWSELVQKADDIIEAHKPEQNWLIKNEIVKNNMLWHKAILKSLFASLPSAELTSNNILEFVKSQSTNRLDINQSYALNRAVLRANSVQDYLDLHTELYLVKEKASQKILLAKEKASEELLLLAEKTAVDPRLLYIKEAPLEDLLAQEISPPKFCRNSKYMKKYVAMILAVMNHNPEEALNFYDMPIQESFLKKDFESLDEAKIKRYEVLDTLTDNLLANYKHWPSGMAWVWISKFIPSIPEWNGNWLERKIVMPPPRPRTEPTEAIIEIAAKRGILSFKDIPTEIESAKAIDSTFALEPKTQKGILERLPQESFTYENLKSYADIDAVWTKQTLGESILARDQRLEGPSAEEMKTLFEQQLEQRKDRPDLLEMYLKTKTIIAENPILTYDLENSEKMQKVFIDKMREGGAWPEDNLRYQHDILFILAKRGPSELTDEYLYNLYMNPLFIYPECTEETMLNHAFWDLHRRKEIYEKYLELTGKVYDENNFRKSAREYATEIVATVNLFFPIPSMERSEILEKLANDIKAGETLTQMIQDEKGRGINEEAALGLGLYLMNKLLNLYPKDKERFALVKFFIRNDELPEVIAQRFRQQVGINRLRKQFLQLPPFGKALAINALIVNILPKSIYSDYGQVVDSLMPEVTYREELEKLIWDNIQDENKPMAKLFYRSFVKALQETAPFQESMFIAFLLGQLANVQGSHPGEKLRYILESLGGTGISIGQKIYQRRMIPDEYLEHLKNMTDHSPLPSRKAIYDRLRILLGVKKISDVLSMKEILGGASTALVVKVILKDGSEAALKVTFEDLPKRTQVEFRKMEAALHYLVEDGGSMYNRLWPVITEVHDGLKGQEDLTQERSKTKKMISLYESRNNINDKLHFKVIQTLPDVGTGDIQFEGSSPEHVFMDLAKGKTLTRLPEDQKKQVFPEIFKREMSILLAEPDQDDMIYFEKDRHMGNFIVNLQTVPSRIFVYDYPLFSNITASERNSLFKLIGWLEARRMYGTNLISQKYFDSQIAEILATEIAEAELNASKIAKHLSNSLADKGETSEKLFALFAVVDEVGTADKIKVRPSLISYTVALGHAERYGQFVESPHEGGAFREMLRPYVLKSDAKFKKIANAESQSVVGLEETQKTFEALSEFK